MPARGTCGEIESEEGDGDRQEQSVVNRGKCLNNEARTEAEEVAPAPLLEPSMQEI